jgi:VIT1/CCC1 family predicted Fe2+/Mn2+ transporter
MDGLVSNVALISGFAGGSAGRHIVLLAGIAGLTAGAASMAIGEYTSVRSQNEAMRAEIEVERHELANSPASEMAELAGVFRRQGVDGKLAALIAAEISRYPETALRVHVREELGFNADDLPGPVVAARASFLAFTVGAAVPLIPYLVGGNSFLPAALLAAVVLFAVGVVISRVTGRSAVRTGLRQLLLGTTAAMITFGLGALLGTTAV